MSGIVGTSHSKSKVIGSSKDTCKFWASWTSGSNPDASFNCSSVNEDAAGQYKFNFLTAFNSVDYAVFGMSRSDDNNAERGAWMNFDGDDTHRTTTYFRVTTHYANADLRDSELVTVGAFGD